MNELYVLDASAVLAFLRDEEGGARVGALMDGAVVSAVNLSEVAAKLSDFGMPPIPVAEALRQFSAISADFDADQALVAGMLRYHTRAKGLSLGDRACLALAQTTGRIALTADRAWLGLDIGVSVEAIR
jgi:ribonuclease VapC